MKFRSRRSSPRRPLRRDVQQNPFTAMKPRAAPAGRRGSSGTPPCGRSRRKRTGEGARHGKGKPAAKNRRTGAVTSPVRA
jgi:hypothetical protein